MDLKERKCEKMELISREALLKSIKGIEVAWYIDGNYETYDDTTIMEIIKEQPTVEAKEVIHGEWIGNTCSACGMNWDENMVNNADDWGYFEPMPNFCPNCGADVRKKV